MLLWYEQLEILQIVILKLCVKKGLQKGRGAEHPQKKGFPQHPNRIEKLKLQRESSSQQYRRRVKSSFSADEMGLNTCVYKWHTLQRTELLPENNFNRVTKIALPRSYIISYHFRG